jgi:hypothetical protein
MEQWQFLIQKQGERAWQPLESQKAQIIEGQYRIVASSLRANADVEVRVIHQSPSEIPPRRRIHKRLRRTNSEGLTAVIPFTYFAPGIWEIRCSGDLMSDMFGTSWQHNLHLQVLPLIATTEITPAKNDIDGNVVSITTLPPASPDFIEVAEDELNLGDVPSYELTELATVTSDVPITHEDYQGITQLPEPDQKIVIETTISNNTDLNISSLDNVVVSELQPSSQVEISTENLNTYNIIETSEQHYTPSTSTESEDLVLEPPVNIPNIPSTLNQENDQNIVVYNTYTTNYTDTAIDEPISLSINTLDLQVRHREVEVITDQPVSPVWVKGDTAEQILQNLIELALPGADQLLEEEAANALQTQTLPLLLTLDEQSYVTQWGRALTVRGRAKLSDDGATYKDDTSEFESVGAVELRVVLSSPLGLEVLVEQQQSLKEQLLPFGFEFSIEIPASCESKLILADIYLYGALSSVGDSILLASQSFTITADVTELLAVQATAKPSEPDMLDIAQPQLTPEPEKPVSIDLELFNLVKTAKKPTSLVTQPSPKRALPLRVDEPRPKQTPQLIDSDSNTSSLLFSKSASLPFLRKRQLSLETASNILVEEKITQEDSELEIELEITNSPEDSTEVLLEASEAVENEVHQQNDYVAIPTNNLVTNNLTVDNQLHNHNYVEANDEPVRTTLPQNTTITSINQPYVSPLIQKWMQSQGYSISETINLEYHSYNTNLAPQAGANIINTHNNLTDKVDISNDNEISSQEDSEPENIIVELPEDIQQVLEDTNQEIETPYTWQAQEIVIDDTFDESINTGDSGLYGVITPEQTVAEMLYSLPFNLEDIEILPVPQINLPSHELVSGKTIRVKVLLKEMRPNIGVKLWVEDCQTRWLLEGPHLLTDLQLNPFAEGMECIKELCIPFGCVEIRIEAISVNIITQQESDKVSVRRTVIPPDLPVLQFDELLGI